MGTIIAIPILLVVSVLQMVIISQLPLLHGNADLLLLTILSWGLNEKAKNVYIIAIFAGLLVGFISAVPFPLPVLIYIAAAWISRQIHSRIWQSPFLAMLLITFISTIFQHMLTIVVLQVMDIKIPFLMSVKEVTIPSLVINLILALPIYLIISDITRWAFKEEEYE